VRADESDSRWCEVKWEYRIAEVEFDLIKVSMKEATGKLNRLGEQGWEAVCSLGESYGGYALFKRAVSRKSE